MSNAPPASPDSTDAEIIDGPELPDHLIAKLRITIPGYELLDKIDSGGQATVYRARELTSGLTVAIKILNGGPNADPSARQRLMREAAALRALNHPNIVCVIEAGRTPVGLDFIVVNYVDGRPLDALWKDRKFSAAIAPEPPARLRLFKRVCDIVQSAHLRGITHRDLSPSNILITTDGQPHILDFGLASTAFDHLLSPAQGNLTVTGQFIGKLQYAAPEQARGGRDAVDIRTDVYALGVILYQILTDGAFPYEVVGALVDVLNNIIHTQPRPPSSHLQNDVAHPSENGIRQKDPPLVNETIEAIVLKALSKNPSDRYQSAGELAADIDQYLSGRPTAAATQRSLVGAIGPPARSRWRRKHILAITSAVIAIGVLMNARFILNWIGLSAVTVSLGLAPATQPAASSNAPELTPRQQDILLQLADAEANIQAINKALKSTGYSVGVAYDRIDSSQKGNEIMNRKGGGPVRWDEFYGKTAKDYPRTGFWDDRMDDHRPKQFEFVYKANNDQIAHAKEQIASLLKDQQALLDRRQKHENDQSRLWATLAWDPVEDREIEFRPLYRFPLKPAGPEAAVLRPVILFLRTADGVAHDGLDSIQADQAGTFQSGSKRMDTAYSTLQQSLADALDATDLTPARVKEGQALKAMCKELAEQSKVIADDYSNALDRDKAKEDDSKLEFRGQLQTSLSSFSTELWELDDDIGRTAASWSVSADKGTPSTSSVLQASGGQLPPGSPASAANPAVPLVTVKFASGDTQLKTLAADSSYFSNRDYLLRDIPDEVLGMTFTCRPAREYAEITIDAAAGAIVYLMLDTDDDRFKDAERVSLNKLLATSGWSRISSTASIGSQSRPHQALYKRAFEKAEQITIPDAVTDGVVVLSKNMELSTGTGDVRPVPPNAPQVFKPGLLGEYFGTAAFKGPVGRRVDPVIDFTWARGEPPIEGCPTPKYSVRWTGQITVPAGGAAAIGENVDDGCNLLVDGVEVAVARKPAMVMSKTPISAGQHTIVIEYWNEKAQGQIKLQWILAGGQLQLVPSDALSHDVAAEHKQ